MHELRVQLNVVGRGSWVEVVGVGVGKKKSLPKRNEN